MTNGNPGPELRMSEITKATECLARKIKIANRLAENKTVWILKQKGARLQKKKATENVGYKLKPKGTKRPTIQKRSPTHQDTNAEILRDI